jgi:hypothetical protein
MTHLDAIPILATTRDITRISYLCSADNPDTEIRRAWQAKVVRMVEGTDSTTAPQPPPRLEQLPAQPCCGGAYNPYE